MSQLLLNHLDLSQEDAIGRLNLTRRSFNALSQSGIQTVGELARLVESGKIYTIRGLGRTSILEIKDTLARVEIGSTSEVEANIDVIPEENSIGRLNLTSRSFNALTSSDIRTVSEIARLVESGKIQTIRGIGRENILEIKDRLAEIKIQDQTQVDANTNTTPRQMTVEAIPDRVIRWQSQLVAKQLAAKLLHKHARIANHSVEEWLAEIKVTENEQVYEALATILSSSLNICEEIEFLLGQIPRQDYLTVLLSRYGFEQKTLLQIGQEIGVSRERVRQIDYELQNKLSDTIQSIVEAKSIKEVKGGPMLLRVQSALLIAGDMGLTLNMNDGPNAFSHQDSLAIGNHKILSVKMLSKL